MGIKPVDIIRKNPQFNKPKNSSSSSPNINSIQVQNVLIRKLKPHL
jgi:hypothetical protein